MHKLIRIFLTLIFIVFAYLQLNDPDPVTWTLGYLYMAIVCLVSIFIQKMKYIIRVTYVIYAVWMLFILPEFIKWINLGMPSITGGMAANQPYIEFTREFLGLFICVLANFYLSKTGYLVFGKNEHE